MKSDRTEQHSYAIPVGTTSYLGDFYGSIGQMHLCADRGPFFKVRIVLDESGDYWTWHSYETDRFCFTHHWREGVEICFPYGSKAEEKAGRGKIKRCRVEVLGKVDYDGKEIG